MKTEDFDEAIKRKLESIDPVIKVKDIESVHQYVAMHRSAFPFLRSPRFFWGLLGTGMVVTALVTWKLTTVADHNSIQPQKLTVQTEKQISASGVTDNNTPVPAISSVVAPD